MRTKVASTLLTLAALTLGPATFSVAAPEDEWQRDWQWHYPDGKPRAARYLYNMGSCMFCNLCVEACPFFALVMSDEHELATTRRDSLVVDLAAEKHLLKGRKAAWWQSKFRAGEEE